MIVIEPLTPLDRTSRTKLHKNNARSRLFCRIAKSLNSLFLRTCQISNITGKKIDVLIDEMPQIVPNLLISVRISNESGLLFSETTCRNKNRGD